MHAARLRGTEVEAAARGHQQLVALRVVVADQVLAAAHVAEVEQHVAAVRARADRPEVGTGAVVADQGEAVVLVERVQILPGHQVVGTKQEVGAAHLAGRRVGQGAAAQRVVPAALLPDARVEDAVGKRPAIRACHGNDRLAGELLPVEQQRIARGGHHGAGLGAVVAGDDPVVLDQGRARIAAPFGIGIDRVGEVAPVDQVVAHRVAPVLARILRRVALVEQVPAALPAAQAVGIVQPVLRADEVVPGHVPVTGELPAGGAKALQQRVGGQLRFLSRKGVGERESRNGGPVVGHGCRR